MLPTTTRIGRLTYADIQQVVEWRWVGREADGGRVQGCKRLCLAGAPIGQLVEW